MASTERGLESTKNKKHGHRRRGNARAELVRGSELDRLELEGLIELQGTGFWLNSFIGNLLSGFVGGERVTPQQVVLALADSIAAIESIPPRSREMRRITGKD